MSGSLKCYKVGNFIDDGGASFHVVRGRNSSCVGQYFMVYYDIYELERECVVMGVWKRGNAPAICTPVTGKTAAEIMEQTDTLIRLKPDVIEWRGDFFEAIYETESVLEIIKEIKTKTDIPLMFTIRSEREGGEPVALSEAEKVNLLKVVCERSAVDFIDYEVLSEKEYVTAIQKVAQKHGKKLVLSYHNFLETPATKELLAIGKEMDDYGANFVKLAVMPQSKEDVYRLLELTWRLDKKVSGAVITMSMGELGIFSRAIGWAYGSVLTFAVGVEASAPGQVPIEQLRKSIQSLQSLCKFE